MFSDDPHEPERWNPKLKLIKEGLLIQESDVGEFPVPLRAIYPLASMCLCGQHEVDHHAVRRSVGSLRERCSRVCS